jgi:hypothetical protein
MNEQSIDKVNKAFDKIIESNAEFSNRLMYMLLPPASVILILVWVIWRTL